MESVDDDDKSKSYVESMKENSLYNKFIQYNNGEHPSQSNVDFLENIYKRLNPEFNKQIPINMDSFNEKLNLYYDFLNNNIKKINCF